MSTSYGFHCKTDDSYTGCSWNSHMRDVMRDLVRMTPALAQIAQMDTQGYVELSIMGYGAYLGDEPIFSWLTEHQGHDLELYNEYGQYEPL